LKRWLGQALVAAGAIGLSAMLLATISLTTFDPRWAVFLSGVLSAAVLSLVSRGANARWTIARRTAQLNATRAKLATEIRLRAHAEESLQRLRSGVELVDESLTSIRSSGCATTTARSSACWAWRAPPSTGAASKT
jgi:C4-dicarboxylate-specific signal transduction histidine kinase